MNAPFELTEGERGSALWERLERHFIARIESLSRENESAHLDEVATAVKRGQIKSFRELLLLGKTKELPPR
jgi:hypothetical protein